MNFDFSYLDIAFKNGSVITVNETDEIAEAVGVKGNKIVFEIYFHNNPYITYTLNYTVALVQRLPIWGCNYRF